MKLTFFNRDKEKGTLKKAFEDPSHSLIVVYGRRRCGKSRLLQEVLGPRHVYFLADQREPALQREAFAIEIAKVLPGFDQGVYPSWYTLFSALSARPTKELVVAIDEFPYLVQMAPELPSIIQKLIDQRSGLQFTLVICGSSQKMMQGMILDSSAPLYGRASEVLKIRPLPAGWIRDALRLQGFSALESYAVWGGVPRYWEQALRFMNRQEAVQALVYDRDGLFHQEPQRLLLDDMRSSVQSHSLLEVIANGANRLSEIAARLAKNAASLSRPLENLIDLGYIRREIPFGTDPKAAKRSLYKIADPFLLFWYRCVQPNLALLEQDRITAVDTLNQERFARQISEIWEDLARESAPRLRVGNIDWMPAQRFWGNDKNGEQIELDVIAGSVDGKHLLVGEVKTGAIKAESVIKSLETKAARLGFSGNKNLVYACWSAKNGDGESSEKGFSFNVDQVMDVMR